MLRTRYFAGSSSNLSQCSIQRSQGRPKRLFLTQCKLFQWSWSPNGAHKNNRGDHMEAKKFIVNVSLPSWKAALRKAGTGTPYVRDDHPIAPFRYDNDKGLLLDRPMKI